MQDVSDRPVCLWQRRVRELKYCSLRDMDLRMVAVMLEGYPGWYLVPGNRDDDKKIPSVGPFYTLMGALRYMLVTERLNK